MEGIEGVSSKVLWMVVGVLIGDGCWYGDRVMEWWDVVGSCGWVECDDVVVWVSFFGLFYGDIVDWFIILCFFVFWLLGVKFVMFFVF